MNALFRMAVLSGTSTALQLHLKRGENVNATDAEGRSPLILAALRDVQEKARQRSDQEMSKLAESVGLPANMKLPF